MGVMGDVKNKLKTMLRKKCGYVPYYRIAITEDRVVKLPITLHTCPATSNQALQACFLGFSGFDLRCLHPGRRCSWVALRALCMPGQSGVSSRLGCVSFSWPSQRTAGAKAATFPSRER